MKTPAKKLIQQKLFEVLDPELNISIVDLGLVYDIRPIGKKQVVITMTLTTIGCPLFPLIEGEIRSKLKEIGVENIKINLVFDPPWTMEKITAKGKAALGL